MDGTTLRRFHGDVRRFKKVCEENGWTLLSSGDGDPTDICVLSVDEYCIGDSRYSIDPDIESYFLSKHEYEVYCDEID